MNLIPVPKCDHVKQCIETGARNSWYLILRLTFFHLPIRLKMIGNRLLLNVSLIKRTTKVFVPKLARRLNSSIYAYDIAADLSFVETDVESRKEGTSIKAKKKKKRRYSSLLSKRSKISFFAFLFVFSYLLDIYDYRYLTICTSNCKYDAVRRVAARFGMKEVTEDSSWNLYWTDLSVSVERAKDMKRYQKVNHFPGMTEICRKDLLARNLNRMLRLFPKDYNFFPKTWCFPAE